MSDALHPAEDLTLNLVQDDSNASAVRLFERIHLFDIIGSQKRAAHGVLGGAFNLGCKGDSAILFDDQIQADPAGHQDALLGNESVQLGADAFRQVFDLSESDERVRSRLGLQRHGVECVNGVDQGVGLRVEPVDRMPAPNEAPKPFQMHDL